MKIFRLAMLAAALVTALAQAGDAAMFRYSTQNDILGLDPHANNHGVTNAMKLNIYETLVYRLPDGSLGPSLATEWQLLNPTTWRFKLRPNVRFHGGEPFTADDVIFSFDRVRQPSSDMSYTVSSIERITKVDDLTIDVVTNGPNPVLLQDLTLFFVVNRAWVERNNAGTVVRTAGASNFINLNSNGTGPFRVTERVIDTRTVLVPNPNWWGRVNHNITQAIFQPIANPATRVAALLSGEMDLVYPIPQQNIQQVSQAANVRVVQGATARTIYLGYDLFRDDLVEQPGTRNPFKDLRVRQAVYHAIDIDAIRRVVMRDSSQNTGLFIAPAVGGFQADMNGRLPLNPDRARQLLTEAGYPNGFSVTFHCPNNRYINDEAICTAIVPMLARVGIQARLVAQGMTQHINQIQGPGFNTSFYLLGWTPGNFDISNPLRELLTMDDGGGAFNIGRYRNARMEALRPLIVNETNEERRRELVREALTIFRNELPLIPLHQEPQVFGLRSTVENFDMHAQEDVRLYQVRMR